ncbi:MAG: phospho-N-acetylmuramoyl-pentapeptide-transferase [Anaerolineales bacterium]|nr:phospho-N-acetylmuramoyl-pentapeptide-transferase [Anaerolineales bacterium]
MFSFVMTVIWGTPLLRVLRHFKVGKIIRVEEPDRHRVKMGTPTMGGVMFIIPVLLLTGLLNAANFIGLDIIGTSILVPLIVLVAYGVLGAIDDWEGVRGRRRGEGMSARTKFAAQVVLALGTAYVLKYLLDVPDMILPGIQGEIELGWWYVPIAAFIIVSESNAVNFTDGLDGLAGLISATAFAAFGGIALLQGQIFLARFCFTIVGALFGFLWFNVHPAELIMGDTGSLSLGATLAVVALMTGQWPLLLMIAIIPLSEALSVVIQIGYFKLTKGKRFFKMAPIHLHFELLGWSETQVVQRFWLIALLAGMVGIGLALV